MPPPPGEIGRHFGYIKNGFCQTFFKFDQIKKKKKKNPFLTLNKHFCHLLQLYVKIYDVNMV